MTFPHPPLFAKLQILTVWQPSRPGPQPLAWGWGLVTSTLSPFPGFRRSMEKRKRRAERSAARNSIWCLSVSALSECPGASDAAPPGNATPPPPAPSRGLARAGRKPGAPGQGMSRWRGRKDPDLCVWSLVLRKGVNSEPGLWASGPRRRHSLTCPPPPPKAGFSKLEALNLLEVFLPIPVSGYKRQSLSFLPRARSLEGCGVCVCARTVVSSQFIFNNVHGGTMCQVLALALQNY